MRVLIIDGQGGRIGKALTEEVKRVDPGIIVTAIGTNSMATAAMLKAGADEGATGENPVVTVAPYADVIMGPIGIVIANSLLGEITPKMADAVGRSHAIRILIPVEKCNTMVAGVAKCSQSEYVKEAVRLLQTETAPGNQPGEC